MAMARSIRHFGPAQATDGGEIRVLTVNNDGTILVGGLFTEFNNTPRQGIVRLLADGTVDPTFAPVTMTCPQFPFFCKRLRCGRRTGCRCERQDHHRRGFHRCERRLENVCGAPEPRWHARSNLRSFWIHSVWSQWWHAVSDSRRRHSI